MPDDESPLATSTRSGGIFISSSTIFLRIRSGLWTGTSSKWMFTKNGAPEKCFSANCFAESVINTSEGREIGSKS